MTDNDNKDPQITADEMREAFEKWYKEAFGFTPRRHEEGYFYKDAVTMWQAWQAATEQQSAELKQLRAERVGLEKWFEENGALLEFKLWRTIRWYNPPNDREICLIRMRGTRDIIGKATYFEDEAKFCIGEGEISLHEVAWMPIYTDSIIEKAARFLNDFRSKLTDSAQSGEGE